jgi:hypothetical protein
MIVMNGRFLALAAVLGLVVALASALAAQTSQEVATVSVFLTVGFWSITNPRLIQIAN